jgi:hypothetical protein
MAFSFQHLSHSHIMPRTLPVVVIIFAACIGFPQHWGTLRLTTAFFVAAFAVLLISAMVTSPPGNIAKPVHFNRITENVKKILFGKEHCPFNSDKRPHKPLDNDKCLIYKYLVNPFLE